MAHGAPSITYTCRHPHRVPTAMNVVVVVIVMFAVVIFIVMAMHVYLKLSSGIAYAMLVLFAAWLAYNSDTVSVYQLSAYVVHLLVVTVSGYVCNSHRTQHAPILTRAPWSDRWTVSHHYGEPPPCRPLCSGLHRPSQSSTPCAPPLFSTLGFTDCMSLLLRQSRIRRHTCPRRPI